MREQLQGLRDESPALPARASSLTARTDMMRVDTFPDGGAPVDEPGWYAADVVLQSFDAKTKTEISPTDAALQEECMRSVVRNGV